MTWISLITCEAQSLTNITAEAQPCELLSDNAEQTNSFVPEKQPHRWCPGLFWLIDSIYLCVIPLSFHSYPYSMFSFLSSSFTGGCLVSLSRPPFGLHTTNSAVTAGWPTLRRARCICFQQPASQWDPVTLQDALTMTGCRCPKLAGRGINYKEFLYFQRSHCTQTVMYRGCKSELLELFGEGTFKTFDLLNVSWVVQLSFDL